MQVNQYKLNVTPANQMTAPAVRMANNGQSMFDQNYQYRGVRLLNHQTQNLYNKSSSLSESTPQSKQNQAQQILSAKIANQSQFDKKKDIQVSEFITPATKNPAKVLQHSSVSNQPNLFFYNQPVIAPNIQLAKQFETQKFQGYGEKDQNGSSNSLSKHPKIHVRSISIQQEHQNPNFSQLIQSSLIANQSFIQQQQQPNNSFIITTATPVAAVKSNNQQNTPSTKQRIFSLHQVPSFNTPGRVNQQLGLNTQTSAQKEMNIIGQNGIESGTQKYYSSQQSNLPTQENLQKSMFNDQSLQFIHQSPSLQQNSNELEDTRHDEVNKMKNDIDYLQSKLSLKEEEVKIFQQYVADRKEVEKEKNQLIQQLEEAKAHNLFLQLQQQKNLQLGITDKDSIDFKDRVLIQQNEMIVLNKEMQGLYKQIQYLESQVQTKDKANQEWTSQVKEKNSQIDFLKEEISILKEKLSLSTSTNLEAHLSEKDQRIIELESQNQIQALKIQSLERNLIQLQKDNKKYISEHKETHNEK